MALALRSGWVTRRWTSSQSSLAAILLITLAIFLHSFFTPHLFRVLQPGCADIYGVPVVEQAEPAKRPLGAHTLTPDGLLVVNPDGAHPIFQLIRDAEAAWEEKCARASKSLDEAVAEYRRRYRRAPPLGFDKWWEYAVKHRVQLPDEYDEIFEDIEPFWGFDPAELARTQEALEKKAGAVTIEKTDARPRLEVVHSTIAEEKKNLQTTVKNILAFARDVEQDLPQLRFTLSPVDNPAMLSDWRIKAMAREAASNGTTITSTDLPTVTKSGWIQACPPDSPARLNPLSLSLPTAPPLPPSSPKTFIASHLEAMDPCVHPSLLSTHGEFISNLDGPLSQPTLVPLFSLCATSLHHDIRPPVPYELESDSDPDGSFEGDLPWEHKLDERLGWRGRTTGTYANPNMLWVHGHRARLVTLTNSFEGNVSVLQVGGEDVPVGEPTMVRLARVNPSWMDVAFADRPIQCDKTGGTCSEMENLWEFRRAQGRHEEGRYKFILDVDGNGWSRRFKRLMTSNALIFKATIYPEWYLSRIAPWVHYVPIQISYTDLYDAVAFFRVHDELAARIAKAGQDWSRRFWRQEDMTAYLYRLLLEYARVSSLDRASMDYVG